MPVERFEDNQDGGRRLEIGGEMTIYGAQALRDELLPHVQAAEALELDLSAVREVDSAGVQILLAMKLAAEQGGKPFAVASPGDAVGEVLDLYRLDGKLNPITNAADTAAQPAEA